MRLSTVAIASFLVARQQAEGFAPLSFTAQRTPTSPWSSSSKKTQLFANLDEFDFLLQESSEALSSSQSNTVPRRRIQFNSGPEGSRKIVLASSTVAPSTDQNFDVDGGVEDVDAADPYADMGLSELTTQAQRLEDPNTQSFSSKMEARIKTMDMQDLIGTLIIPSIIVFAGAKWIFGKVANRAGESLETTLDSFCTEMLHHDGDFDEMELCVKTYSKKLMFLGPTKTSTMLKRYLQLYAKKKTVSPQAISSLAYVFSLFKLSEEKAAEILVTLCRQMGGEKISSSGKLLFFGSRILKSKEGKAALEPIKDMIKATYSEQSVAETLVETSQQAMGEAAYRAAVQAGGKNQKSLTIGWEILGLDKKTATSIFEDEAEDGFKTMREVMYGGQSRKYDSKGNLLNKETGDLDDPENAIGDDEPEQDVTSNVFECGECGFTLFIAKGRTEKFYGKGFKCPECGAAKDKFSAKDMDEE